MCEGFEWGRLHFVCDGQLVVRARVPPATHSHQDGGVGASVWPIAIIRPNLTSHRDHSHS